MLTRFALKIYTGRARSVERFDVNGKSVTESLRGWLTERSPFLVASHNII